LMEKKGKSELGKVEVSNTANNEKSEQWNGSVRRTETDFEIYSKWKVLDGQISWGMGIMGGMGLLLPRGDGGFHENEGMFCRSRQTVVREMDVVCLVEGASRLDECPELVQREYANEEEDEEDDDEGNNDNVVHPRLGSRRLRSLLNTETRLRRTDLITSRTRPSRGA
ncbi:hypothetical protein PFISCL1PPCAC_125, partial [Pristionchus fissidentatus]